MLIGVVLLLLPAAAANMAPVLVSRIPFFEHPLDNHLSIRGRRIFGANKTVRGLVAGVLASTLVFWIETLFAESLAPYALLDYATAHPLVFGPLFGAGALLGDAAKSFAKRQADIPPGHSWPPFDQVDWVIGALVAISPFYMFAIPVYLLSLFLGGALHPVVNIAGYRLGIKDSVL